MNPPHQPPARDYDADGFRKAGPGMTALRISDTRDIVMGGVGEEVRAALVKKRDQG